MIRERTTFVLGAGASAPFGFPSGQALASQVVQTFRQGNDEKVGLLQELGYDRKDLSAFAEALQRSGKTSVDAFLEYRADMAPIGKAAIAACLIPYEVESRFYQDKTADENWYHWLFAALNASPATFTENQVSIVTFNYDRSLEHYLFTCLSNSFNLDVKASAKLVNAIPITHLHGILGRLPWQEGQGDPKPYDGAISKDAIRTGRDGIRVIHEGRYDDPPMRAAQEIINAADRLVFLGFGYHEANLDRLRIDRNRAFSFVGGSGFGMKALEQMRAGRLLPQGFVWGAEHWGAREFLRQRADLT
jgi:hypothetical protein